MTMISDWNLNLKENERIDDLLAGGLKIIQNNKEFCFSIDAVLLAHFVTVRKNAKGLDQNNDNERKVSRNKQKPVDRHFDHCGCILAVRRYIHGICLSLFHSGAEREYTVYQGRYS